MIQQRLRQWIQHPELLDRNSLYELRVLLARYPYFQTVRLLYLKNLFILQDHSFKDELRKSTLYIADLSVLFYYIEGERLVIRKHERMETDGGEVKGVDRTLDLIDRFLSDLPDEPVRELPMPEVSVDYTSILRLESEGQEAEALPLKGQALIDDFLRRSEEEPVELLSAVPEAAGDAESVAEDPDSLGGQEEPEEESGGAQDMDESYFTETLAKIYVKQRRYDKALEIIKKLNLKYPKKNAYFADQIRFLEKLIINAKSK